MLARIVRPGRPYEVTVILLKDDIMGGVMCTVNITDDMNYWPVTDSFIIPSGEKIGSLAVRVHMQLLVNHNL